MKSSSSEFTPTPSDDESLASNHSATLEFIQAWEPHRTSPSTTNCLEEQVHWNSSSSSESLVKTSGNAKLNNSSSILSSSTHAAPSPIKFKGRQRLRKQKSSDLRYNLALEKLRKLKPNNSEFFTFGDVELSEAESIVLSLGLKFQPHVSYSNKEIHTSIENSINVLNRKLKLKLYFANNNNSNEQGIPSILDNNFIPEAENEDWFQLIDAYSANAIEQLRKEKPFISTIPIEHRLIQKTLYKLKKRKDIIVKPSDKNLGIAIFSKSFYATICYEHLSDTSTYQPISNEDPRWYTFNATGFEELRNILAKHNALFSSTVNKSLSKLARSLLQLNYLCPEKLRTAKFYGLPKVHKTPLTIRPIIDNVNSVSYFTSKYLHAKLWKLLPKLNSICKSCSEVILDLSDADKSFAPDSAILCADIKQLYPSIPLDFGLKAVHYVINSFPSIFSNDEILLTMDLLHWVLTNNYFTFEDQLYLQIKGTAMGTPVAVAYANIVIFYMESFCIQQVSPQYYKRFVDDVIAIIPIEEGKQFIVCFNSINSSIQFDESSVTLADNGIFLDGKFFLVKHVETNKLIIKTTIYQKPMNKYLYIPPSSAHPPQLLRNIIRQEIMRYKLLCSEEEDFTKVKQAFFQRLLQRGYSIQYLESIFGTDIPSRAKLLEKLKFKKLKEVNAISNPIITLQLPDIIDGPNLKSILKFPTELTEHPKFAQVYSRNLIIGFKYNGSIKDTLVHS